MVAIQEVSARIGRVTGGGIAANLRKSYPKWHLYSVVALMAAANLFNLGADIGAMGAAAQLLFPARIGIYIVLFGTVSLLLQLFIPYTKYVRYLKWLTLSLFAYVAAAFFAHAPWREIVWLTPHVSFTKPYLTALVAVLGTTISPYLFFWQASQEVEEVKSNRGEKALKRDPKQAPDQFGRIKVDTYLGMAISNLVAFFIVLTTAATLHAHGVMDISTSAQAAKALEPVAGRWAFLFFVCGIMGTGLLVPVLAGSSAYAIGEAANWRASLEHTPATAPKFYVAITAATLIGLSLNFMHINPIKALFWAAVLNGVTAAPLMAVIMVVAASRSVMGKFVLPLHLRLMGWLATAVMFGVCISLFATLR